MYSQASAKHACETAKTPRQETRTAYTHASAGHACVTANYMTRTLSHGLGSRPVPPNTNP